MQVHRKSTPHSSMTDRTSGHLVEGTVTERTFSVSLVGLYNDLCLISNQDSGFLHIVRVGICFEGKYRVL